MIWASSFVALCFSAFALAAESARNSKVCRTKACRAAAQSLIAAMDSSTDPCADFFKFACGTWIEKKQIPADQGQFSAIAQLNNRVNEMMRQLFQSAKSSSRRRNKSRKSKRKRGKAAQRRRRGKSGKGRGTRKSRGSEQVTIPEKCEVDALEAPAVDPALQESATQTKESRATTLARRAYDVCVDEKRRRKVGSRDLRRLIKELGGWPLLGDRSVGKKNGDGRQELSRLMGEVNLGLVTAAPVKDFRNSSRTTIMLDQAAPGLAVDYLRNSRKYGKQVKAYRKLMRRVARLVAADAGASSAAVNAGVKAVVALEKRLAKIQTPAAERHDHTRMDNPMRLSELEALLPEVDFETMLKTQLPPDVAAAITQNTVVTVAEVDYLKKLSRILRSTPLDTLQSLLIWRLVQLFVSDMDERFDKATQKFAKALSGATSLQKKSASCISFLETTLKEAVGAMFVEAYVDEKTLRRSEDLIKRIQASLMRTMKRLRWMDKKTKARYYMSSNTVAGFMKARDCRRRRWRRGSRCGGWSVRPSSSATLAASTPSSKTFIYSSFSITAYYSLPCDMSRLSFAASDSQVTVARALMDWRGQLEWRKLLHDSTGELEFQMSTSIVNAWYSPLDNAIYFPAAFLQPPMFAADRPLGMNFGALGFVAGHEATHAYDVSGSQYDGKGDLHDWWSPSSKAAFIKQRKCLVKEYDAFKVPGTKVNVNGALTLGENVADIGGLKVAYKAYRKRVKELGAEEPRLPGLEKYSPNQVFFLSAAQGWCSKGRPATNLRLALGDTHSHPKWRVNGPARNLREFARAWRCPSGSPMNPRNKCSVW